MKESDLLDMRKCIVCNQPIEDLDPVDLYILRGTHSQVPDSTHYESKSYYRCINPACLSCHLIMISWIVVYHKKCVPDCQLFGVCGICDALKETQKLSEKLPEKLPEKRPSVDDSKKPTRTVSDSEDERSTRRRPLRRNESDEEDRRVVRRHPSRSTRAPTYHEEESDDDIRERTPKKRRVVSSRSAAPNTRHEEVILFPRIEESMVVGILNEVMNMVFGESSDDKQLTLSVKLKLRSVVAVGVCEIVYCSGFRVSLSLFNAAFFIWSFFYNAISENREV